MKIAFLDYWEYPNSFDPHNNFFLHLLRQIFENVSVSDPEDADVIFSLGFGVILDSRIALEFNMLEKM